MIDSIYLYRSAVIIDSESSSSSFSHSHISFSIWLSVSDESSRFSDFFNCSITFETLSKSLIEYHLCFSSERLWRIASSIWASVCSTQGSKRCWYSAFLFSFAIFMASSTACVHPSFLRAEISKTGQFNNSDILLMWILSPFFLTTSIIFTATTIGMPSSTSCVVR